MMLRETLRGLFAEYKNLSVVEQMEWDGQWVPRAALEKMGIIPADCEFIYQLNPLPEWGKCWRDFEKDGDWNDALYPIGNGIKQPIEKARRRSAAR